MITKKSIAISAIALLVLVAGALLVFQVSEEELPRPNDDNQLDGGASLPADSPMPDANETEGGQSVAHEIGIRGRNNTPRERVNRHAESLPTEHEFLHDGQVDAQAISQLLASEPNAFHGQLNRLEDEALEDADALELAEIYRDALTDHLSELSEDIALSAFACGLRLCMGSISPPTELNFQQWETALNAFLQDPNAPPVYVSTTKPFEDKDAGYPAEYRWLFSIDPDSSGISVTLDF